MTQLAFSGVGVSFGAVTVFSDVTFTVGAGERWGVIGRNGTGKTTLFRLLTGDLAPSRGSITRQAGLRVSLLEQHRDYGTAATVWEAAAGELGELLALEQSLIEQAAALGADPSPAALERYGRDLERFEREGGYAVTSRIDAVLHGLGFDPQAARITPVGALSGGERGRLGLVRQLVSTADVLLLDEPTNHLDLDTTRWLEEHLRDIDRTVLLVSHDRAFLASTVDHVLHFEGGTATPYDGSYAHFVAQRAERRLTQQRAFDQQQRKIAAESDYIARNIAGQNSRQAKGRRKRLERLPRLSPPIQDEDALALRFDSGQRGGDVVVSAKDVRVAIGERRLIDGFTGVLRRGDILGLVGPNGAGKTTLLKALFGHHPVAGGELRLGASIDAGWYRQDLSQVPLDRAIYDAIADLRPQWERRLVQGHLGRFGFSGDDVQRRAGVLSGGERARVALAMLMLSRHNLLVLDEPTNHLDVESIEVLEDALERYAGTVILVSHDRELLRALTTRVWILHDGRVTDYEGGFADWEVASAERAHAAAVRAVEEEALRRVHERQKVNRPAKVTGADRRREARAAERALEEAESRVTSLEARVAEVTKALEDPDLYTSPEGLSRSQRLGSELDGLKRELDAALVAWADASASVERLSSAGR
ncbi:MAG: ABC-F family ATP-binding cassette domain-containing protein [Gemmatimonadaceae bacterium]|nr:ABC-F family ATP-binding cassette domain-containing protein [Gemmatimonadaceae bacterium]